MPKPYGGPRGGGWFRMSEVPLYSRGRTLVSEAVGACPSEWSTWGGPLGTPSVAGGINQLGFRTVE